MVLYLNEVTSASFPILHGQCVVSGNAILTWAYYRCEVRAWFVIVSPWVQQETPALFKQGTPRDLISRRNPRLIHITKHYWRHSWCSLFSLRNTNADDLNHHFDRWNETEVRINRTNQSKYKCKCTYRICAFYNNKKYQRWRIEQAKKCSPQDFITPTLNKNWSDINEFISDVFAMPFYRHRQLTYFYVNAIDKDRSKR